MHEQQLLLDKALIKDFQNALSNIESLKNDLSHQLHEKDVQIELLQEYISEMQRDDFDYSPSQLSPFTTPTKQQDNNEKNVTVNGKSDLVCQLEDCLNAVHVLLLKATTSSDSGSPPHHLSSTSHGNSDPVSSSQEDQNHRQHYTDADVIHSTSVATQQDHLLEEIEMLKLENQVRDQCLEDMKQMLEQEEQDKMHLRQDIVRLEDELTEALQLADLLVSPQQQHQKYIQDLQALLQVKDEMIQRLQSDTQASIKSKDDYIKKIEETLISENTRLTQFQNKIVELSENLNAAQQSRQDADAAISEQSAVIAQLQTDLKRLAHCENEIQQSHRYTDAATKEQSTMIEVQVDLNRRAQYENDISEIREKLHVSQQSCRNANATMSEQSATIAELQMDLNRLAQCEIEISELREKLSSSQQTCQDADAIISEKSATIAQLQIDLNQLEQCEKQIAELQEKLNASEKSYHEASTTISEKSATIAQLQIDLNRLAQCEKKTAELQEKLDASEKSYQEASTIISEKSATIAQLQIDLNQLAQYENQIAELQEKLDASEKSYQEASAIISEKSATIAQLQIDLNQLAQYENQIAELQEKLDASEKSYAVSEKSATIAQIQTDSNRLAQGENEIAELQKTLDTSQKSYQTANTTMIEQYTVITQLQTDIDALKSAVVPSSDGKSSDSVQQQSYSSSFVENLQDSLNEKDAQLEQLLKELEKTRVELQVSMKENQRQSFVLQQLQDELSITQSNVHELQSNFEEMTVAYEEQLQESESALAERSNLLHQLKSASATGDCLDCAQLATALEDATTKYRFKLQDLELALAEKSTLYDQLRSRLNADIQLQVERTVTINEGKLADLENTLQQKSSLINQLELDKAENEKLTHALKQDLEDLQKTLKLQEDKLCEWSHKALEQTSQNSQLTDRLNSELVDLKSCLENSVQENEQKEIELTSLRNCINEREGEICRLNDVIKELNDKNLRVIDESEKQKEQEIILLNSRLAEKEREMSRINDLLKEMEQQSFHVNEEIPHMIDEAVEKKEQEIILLNACLGEKEREISQIKDIFKEMEQESLHLTEELLQQKDDEIISLNKCIAEKEDEIKRVANVLSETQQKNLMISEDNNRLQNNLKLVEEDLEKKTIELNHLREERNRIKYQEQNSLRGSQNSSAKEHRIVESVLESDDESLRTEDDNVSQISHLDSMSLLQQRVDELISIQDTLAAREKSALDDEIEEIDLLRQKINKLEEELGESNKLNGNLKQRINFLNDSVFEREKTIAVLDAEVKKNLAQQNEVEQLRNEISRSQGKCSENDNERNDLQKKIAELNAKVAESDKTAALLQHYVQESSNISSKIRSLLTFVKTKNNQALITNTFVSSQNVFGVGNDRDLLDEVLNHWKVVMQQKEDEIHIQKEKFESLELALKNKADHIENLENRSEELKVCNKNLEVRLVDSELKMKRAFVLIGKANSELLYYKLLIDYLEDLMKMSVSNNHIDAPKCEIEKFSWDPTYHILSDASTEDMAATLSVYENNINNTGYDLRSNECFHKLYSSVIELKLDLCAKQEESRALSEYTERLKAELAQGKSHDASLQTLSDEANYLREQKNKLENMLLKSQNECQNLQQDLYDVRRKFEKMEMEKIPELISTLEDSEMNKEIFERRCKDLEAALTESEKYQDETRVSMEALERHVDELKAKLESAGIKLSLKETQLKHSEDHLEKWKSNLQTMTHHCETANETIRHLEKLLKQQQMVAQEQETELNSLREQVKFHLSNFEYLERNYSTYRETIEKATSKLNDENKSQKDHVEAVNRERTIEHKRLEAMEKDLIQIKKTLERERANSSSEITELRASNAHLLEVSERQMNQVTSLKETMRSLTKNLDDIKLERDQLEENLAMSQKEIEALVEDLTSMQLAVESDSRESAAHAEKLKEEIAELKRTIYDMKRSEDIHVQALHSRSRELEQVSNLESETRRKILELEKEIENNVVKSRDVNNEVRKLKESLTEANSVNQKLRLKLDETETYLQESNHSLQDAQDRIMRLKNDILEKSKQIAQLESQSHIVTRQEARIKHLEESLKARVERERDLNQRTRTSTVSAVNLLSENRILQTKIENAGREKKLMENQISKLKAELDLSVKRQRDLNSFLSKTAESKEQSASSSIGLEMELDECKTEIISLTKKLAKLESDKIALEMNYNNAKDKILQVTGLLEKEIREKQRIVNYSRIA